MRRLLILPLALAVAFAGYWLMVARGVEGGFRNWFAERGADGWVAEYGSLSTSGFPRRFETVLTDITIADPETGVAWTAPRFAVEADAFKPHRITATWPEVQTLASPIERITITSEGMDARVEFVPRTRLELRAIEGSLAGAMLSSTLGWETRIERGGLSATARNGRRNAYTIRFTASNVTPSDDLRRSLDPARLLPDVIDGVVMVADVAFDAPWDRYAIEEARPQINSLDLGNLQAQWGGIELRAAGNLKVDSEGVPDGRITVKVTNWRDLLQVAGNAGLLPAPLMPTIERAFEIIAGLSGPPDTLDAPLTFSSGIVSFGPVPLGRAPRLVLR